MKIDGARGAFGLAGAALLAGLGRRGDSRGDIPLAARMLSSALVLAGALLLGRRGGRAARTAAAGMGLGLLGDLVMAGVLPVPERVQGGMLAFGAGHALYIRAIGERARALGGWAPGERAAGLALGWGVAAAGWWALARSPSAGRLLNGAALAYALLLGSMAGLAAALARRHPGQAPLAAGGALFLLSDLILAGEIFRQASFPHIGDVIWVTYLAGQALIVDTLGRELSP